MRVYRQLLKKCDSKKQQRQIKEFSMTYLNKIYYSSGGFVIALGCLF
jgi:hypothetical protein